MTMLIAHVYVGVWQMSFGKVRTDFELFFTAVISCLDGTVQSAKYLIFNTTSLTASNCHKIHMTPKLITKEVSERCSIQKSCQTLNKAYKMLQLRIKVGHSVKNETAFTNLLKAFLSPKVGWVRSSYWSHKRVKSPGQRIMRGFNWRRKLLMLQCGQLSGDVYNLRLRWMTQVSILGSRQAPSSSLLSLQKYVDKLRLNAGILAQTINKVSERIPGLTSFVS